MISVIAFDGLNRCGKGTQTQMLQRHLEELGILAIIVRGDGSREGGGGSQGDPKSLWWGSFKTRLEGLEKGRQWFDQWNQAACLLAREFIHWKEIRMPVIMSKVGYEDGALLIDRSLISRIMVLRQADEYNGLESLYTIGGLSQGIDWEDVLPDVLFNFNVPHQVLLSRLESDDPKYQFRREIIDRCFSLHVSVTKNLPNAINARTINIDGDRVPGNIHTDILAASLPLIQRT
ncbi:MAG: hypothetical protein UT05_C0016G0008 [Parcubacteria group bacterium GW2011_GWF2_38_76]|nr:MAG: hypothetical protein UT05_C0016G0008 [Parcubacteria group bacterium GW2011_GWF2_38_76]